MDKDEASPFWLSLRVALKPRRDPFQRTCSALVVGPFLPRFQRDWKTIDVRWSRLTLHAGCPDMDLVVIKNV